MDEVQPQPGKTTRRDLATCCRREVITPDRRRWPGAAAEKGGSWPISSLDWHDSEEDWPREKHPAELLYRPE